MQKYCSNNNKHILQQPIKRMNAQALLSVCIYALRYWKCCRFLNIKDSCIYFIQFETIHCKFRFYTFFYRVGPIFFGKCFFLFTASGWTFVRQTQISLHLHLQYNCIFYTTEIALYAMRLMCMVCEC